jgi:hypothetical protein
MEYIIDIICGLAILLHILVHIYLYLGRYKSPLITYIISAEMDKIDVTKIDRSYLSKIKQLATIQSLITIIISILYMIKFKHHSSDIRSTLVLLLVTSRYFFSVLITRIIEKA